MLLHASASLFLCLATSLLHAQANGKLQLHFMNVDQGDGAVLISPGGEVVLFDNGVRNMCDLPLSYLQQLGVTEIDYHVASHYHDDHIGCSAEVLGEFPLQIAALDRGSSYTTATYKRYRKIIGSKRQKVTTDTILTLDAGSAQPVYITFPAFNGNKQAGAKDENDLSVVAVVRFGDFDAEIGGDLSGANTGKYVDIETSVGPLVGQVEVYKAHHHGSAHSTNTAWLAATAPRIAIISAGEESKHGHPTTSAMKRLHTARLRTYWTTEGGGAKPNPKWDVISGNTIVEIGPGEDEFTVTREDGIIDTFPLWSTQHLHPLVAVEESAGESAVTFAWSKRSDVYHFGTCTWVQNIHARNLEQGSAPPPGKRLHAGCPR